MSEDKLSALTVAQLKEFCVKKGVKYPNGMRKADAIQYIIGAIQEAKSDSSVKGYRDKKVKLKAVYVNDEVDWLEHLNYYGWATVPIPSWKEHYVSIFFDWFENCCSNFDRDDMDTWIDSNMVPVVNGIIKKDFGHNEFLWEIRELCIPIFEQIWGIEGKKLLCSFDGGCLLKGIKKKELNMKNMWIHTDHPRNLSEDLIKTVGGMECVQGVVNFVDCGPKDGGLVLVEASDEILDKYFEEYPSTGYTWSRANSVSELFDNKRLIKICAPAGHIILWNGRTFHCNVPPSDINSFRMCTYVSMQPRANATEKELKKRIELYEAGKMTGHWCYGPYFAGNKGLNTYGKKQITVEEVEIAELNRKRRRLVGK